jgi:RHS repeat-associated protein
MRTTPAAEGKRRLMRAAAALLLLSAALLLPTHAEASLERTNAAELAPQSPAASLPLALTEPEPESPFALFAGGELAHSLRRGQVEPPRPGDAGEGRFSLFGYDQPAFGYDRGPHPLAGVSLLQQQVVPASELRYPKTRIGGLRVFSQDLYVVQRELSLELQWGCADFRCGISEGLSQGAYTDPITGLAYHRARWYDARNASWLSQDPIGDKDSPNLYGFVGARPHEKTDPLGLATDIELPRIMELIQSAGEEAARRHGLTSLAEVEKHGELGTQVHRTMQELLAPGGTYHHPRVLTEVEVGPGGRILNFGGRGFAQSGSMVKDVVVLRQGVSPAAIRLGATEAKTVTQLVVDLKTGIRGAAMREGATLTRFGVTNVKLKPFQNIFEQRAKSVKMLQRLERFKPLAKIVPVLGALVTGLTIADAKEALAAGDPERAAKVMMGLDAVEDSTKALANETERRLKEWEDSIGLSRETRTKAADELEK